MAPRRPNDPGIPTSPDQLDRGLRGPIGGVTRIGARAFALAFLVGCGLLVAILYGLNRTSPGSRNIAEAANASPAPQQPNASHFGANEPIVAPAAPGTPAPLVLSDPAVPDLASPQGAPNAAQQGPTAEQQFAMQLREEATRARAAAEQKRHELADSALTGPILTAGGAGGERGQLAYAGNGGDAREAGLVGRAAAAPAEGRAAQATAYLDGPAGQYAVQPANVVLPQGGNPKDFLQAQRFAPVSPYEIVASSVIPAILITGLDSELPGLVSAEVREDVYDSKTGRYLLIPRGSRLVGLYNSQIQYGQTRVLVAWQRLIFPDTSSIDLLNMSGADVQGGAGLSGSVDNHYGKIFGAALLTSVIAAGAELASPQSTSVFTNPSAGQVISQAVGQQIAQTSTQIVQKNLNIPPTLHIPRGYSFIVIVDRDMVLPGVYHGG
jgi:type IV secretion system protein VirB10